MQLLCQYEPESVLKFLETFDSYRVEHCLRLCQEYGIIDAAAFLLERVGDVGSGLLLTLSGLDDKFLRLETAVESAVSRVVKGSVNMEHFSTVLNMEEVCIVLSSASIIYEDIFIFMVVEGLFGKLTMYVIFLVQVNDIRNILHACTGLCQRNTPRLNPEESETLWFKLLDS